MSDQWNFASAFSSAAVVIPTLLLALVLQSELLPVAARLSTRIRREVRGTMRAPQTEWLSTVLTPGSWLARLVTATFRPSVLVGFAGLAEVVALFGVAQPPAQREQQAGLGLAFGGLGLCAVVITLLMAYITIGLVGVAEDAEEEQWEAAHEGPDDRDRRAPS